MSDTNTRTRAQVAIDLLETPIGRLEVEACAEGLSAIRFRGQDGNVTRVEGDVVARRWVNEALAQLRAYFDRKLERFDIPLVMEGSPSYRRVWEEVARVPFGQTVSYSEIARRIGNPKAVRAVGTANARNPIPIVVPCHRVIGKDGRLVGYGGGLDAKCWLLAHEGARLC